MTSKKVEVKNDTGLHARPASVFVQEAEKYEAKIKLINEENEANAKSIMGVMSLGVEQGNEITIKAEGSDAQKAVDNLVKLVQDDFGE